MPAFALIGHPLTHSFSKKFFEEKFATEGLVNNAFENVSAPTIEQAVEELHTLQNLHGFCVTIPYKQAILPFLHTVSAEVAQIGACNCVVINGNKWMGFNTDYVGFWQSFQPLLQPHHQRALVLGNGGAAKAVLYALQLHGITATIVTRKAQVGCITYHEITEETLAQNPIIINTTPLGTFPAVAEKPAIPYEYLGANHYCFDLVYNPAETAFLASAKAQGASTANGLQMLHLQANENWRLWQNAL